MDGNRETAFVVARARRRNRRGFFDWGPRFDAEPEACVSLTAVDAANWAAAPSRVANTLCPNPRRSRRNDPSIPRSRRPRDR